METYNAKNYGVCFSHSYTFVDMKAHIELST